ncbi:hypothetical protein YQE_00403, partial [Dendroctonus ponderosae]
MQDHIKPDDVCHFQFTSMHNDLWDAHYVRGSDQQAAVAQVGHSSRDCHQRRGAILGSFVPGNEETLESSKSQSIGINLHEATFSISVFQSIYGLSESTAVAFQSLPDDDELHSTSTVGYVGDHLEVKIVDAEVRRDEDDGMPAPADQGKIVPRGTPGELLIRGYSTTLGYWQNEEKTNELIGRDKWLHTGDQFVLQEDGYGRIVGRIKDMIIRGGENIYPIEVEDVLNQHPHVLEVQVVGLPHERLGEEVCACIRVQKNMSVTLSDLKTHCAGKLARFKIPSRLEIFDSFPKTTSGKIQKHKIIETIVKERQFCN